MKDQKTYEHRHRANGLVVSVRKANQRFSDLWPAGYDVVLEGRGTVLTGLPREVAQTAAHRLAFTPYPRLELEAIRDELKASGF